MTALALVAWAAVLINFCVTGTIIIGLLCIVLYFGDLITGNPVDRAFRERRRHARRTARAMREMSEIRRKTIERMDRAEEEGWQ